MENISDIKSFLVASLIVNLIPGVDRIIVLNVSIKSGLKSGLITSLGISLATFIHALIVSLSLYWLVNERILKLIQGFGVAYLIGLALFLIWKGFGNKSESTAYVLSSNSFVQGFMIHFANPLAIAFILSFIPQFILDHTQFAITFILLSSISNTIGLTMNVLTASLFGQLRDIAKNSQLNAVISVAAGLAILFLAVTKLWEWVH